MTYDRQARTPLEPPERLPAYIPTPQQPLLFTRDDGIEIAGGTWYDAKNTSAGPTPAVTFTARLSGRNLGGLTIYPDPKEPGTFWVGRVRVEKGRKFRRKGIATDLYRQAARWLKGKGGKLRQGMITSDAAAKMWEKWHREGLAEGKYLNVEKWSTYSYDRRRAHKPADERGMWPIRGFPDRVWIAGKVFNKAQFTQPYPGVLAQYREDTDKDSAHLKVFEDGSWLINHTDDFNPEKGQLIEHFIADMMV